jgi:hypothetical protein
VKYLQMRGLGVTAYSAYSAYTAYSAYSAQTAYAKLLADQQAAAQAAAFGAGMAAQLEAQRKIREAQLAASAGAQAAYTAYTSNANQSVSFPVETGTAPVWHPCGPNMHYVDGRGCVYDDVDASLVVDTSPSGEAPQKITASTDPAVKDVLLQQPAQKPVVQIMPTKAPATVKGGTTDTAASSSGSYWLYGLLGVAALVGIYVVARRST